MCIQYRTVVLWDPEVIDVEFVGSDASVPPALRGLARSGVKITTGVPAATAGVWIPGALVQNAVDGNVKVNTGTTASPVWT